MTGTIPPLPGEQNGSTIGTRHLWVVLASGCRKTEEEVRTEFISHFGREPDRLHQETRNDMTLWWMGWVTREESRRWVERHDRDTTAV